MGATVLTTAMDEASFVAIGEGHLTQEIPRFTAAVCDETAPHGLSAMALETSPAAASFVESIVLMLREDATSTDGDWIKSSLRLQAG